MCDKSDITVLGQISTYTTPYCAGWGVLYTIVPLALSHVGWGVLHTIAPSTLS